MLPSRALLLQQTWEGTPEARQLRVRFPLLYHFPSYFINFLCSERILELQLQRPATVLDLFGHTIRNKFNLERARGSLF
jgi:hypothetical protein